MEALIVTLIVLFAYFCPTIVAAARAHHNRTAILITNLFLGWTFIGWVVALIWACTVVQKARPALQE